MNTKENANQVRYFDIIGGPNKDRLFDSCKYAFDKSAKISADFDVALGTTMPPEHPGAAYILMGINDIKVCSIEHEDGSGESFNLAGYCQADLKLGEGYKPYRFSAYYNAKTRRGTISFQ